MAISPTNHPTNKPTFKMAPSFCIVVTGLPASGKTTVGKKVAQALAIPLIDKDDYLEALYEERGIGDTAWRQALSRESDQLFQQASVAKKAAVLVSHWRPPNLETQSGTPTDWLSQSFDQIVELFCECPAEEAARRFANRKRHAGHLDHLKSFDQLLDWMRVYEQQLPLCLGKMVRFDTLAKQSADDLIKQLKRQLQTTL